VGHRLQTVLDDRDVPGLQHRDLALVDVATHHVMADVSEADAGGQTDVSGPDDAKTNGGTRHRGKATRALRASCPRMSCPTVGHEIPHDESVVRYGR
jgi:hypothetical protein